MALWHWKALDEQGTALKGIWEENSKRSVVARLRDQKLFPVSIQKDILRSFLLKLNSNDRKIYWSRSARKLGSMLEAGIPLLTALEIMADKENDSYKKRAWNTVFQSVRQGNELGSSLKGFTPHLEPHLIALVSIGERSGTLTKSLLEISAQLEEEHNFGQKIKAALFYPSLLLGVAVIIVYFLSVFVLPMYVNLFDSLDAELPQITTILFSIGSYIPFILSLLGVIILACVLYNFGGSHNRQHSFIYLLPGIGRIKKYQEMILFCSLLQRLLEAGISLPQSLNLLAGAMSGKDMKKLVADLAHEVNEGRRLAPVFAFSGIFPAEAAKMIGIGEESGKLSEMLGYMTRLFRNDLEQKLQGWMNLLQPLLIIWIAGIVGVVAIGVLLPIFEMSMYIR